MRILLFILTIAFAGELEVEGNLKVTGSVQIGTIDSLEQVILQQQQQISTLQALILQLQEEISYLAQQLGYTDCEGVINGGAEIDCAGVCGGLAILDCNDECEGLAVIDECGICDGSGLPCQVYDYDGNGYSTIIIGEQVWLQQNLKVTHYNDGDPIPNLNNSADWTNASNSNAPGYCVMENDGIDVSYDEYGYLYKGSVFDDESGVCPINFHVPTDDEWKELELYLDMPEDELDLDAWRGEDEGVGSKLKSDLGIYWNGSGGNNQSEFSAIGGGYRSPTTGIFHYLHESGYFWGSSIDGSYNNRELKYNLGGIARSSSTIPNYGFSIRCVAD